MCIVNRITNLYCFMLTFFILIACITCEDSKEQWVMLNKMGNTRYKILTVERIIDNANQTYISRIKAPKLTQIKKDRAFEDLITELEMTPVSSCSDGVSAIFEAKVHVTTVSDTYIIPPFWLTSGTERLFLEFNPFITIQKQVNFPFNNCQFQVERKEESGGTRYKITMQGCVYQTSFSASIGKMTPGGLRTIGYNVKPSCDVYPFSEILDFNVVGQVSSLFINRTALEKDDMEVTSFKFLIETSNWSDDFDVISFLTYEFSLA